MTSFIRRSPLRSKLALTTALAGGVVGFGGIAQAQNTPTTPTVAEGVGVQFNGGGAGNANGTPTNLNVNLGANPNTIINWVDFDVSAGSTVNFDSSLGVAPAAVLNRVTGGTTSNIQGSITSDANVAVWLLNPNGILIGNGGSTNIATGSFVASTLGITDADFMAGTNYSLNGPAGSTTGITINGATITTADGNRGLVLVAPQINANGTFDAGDGDVAFITATDVTLSYGLGGGPLEVTIGAGTAVSGASQVVQGTVNGRNVYFALASQAAVTDALLDVSAAVTATTAALTDTGIVLSGGRNVTGAVTVTANATTSGAVDIGAAGNLTATGQGGQIRAFATDAIDVDGDIDASRAVHLEGTGAVSANNIVSQRSVTVLAGGAAAVSGNVTAEDAYSVTGASVALGVDVGAETQRSNDAVSIESTAGAITGGVGLTLRSDHNGGGGDDLTLSSTGGDILFNANSSVEGGIARQSDVRVRSDLATRVVQLGNVSADGLLGAVGGGGFANGVTRSAGITLGNVNLVDTLSLTSSTGNVTTGNIAVTGNNQDVSVVATAGAVSIGGIAADENVTVTAGGAAAIAGAVTAGGDYAVTGGTVALGNDVDSEVQQANGTVVIQSTVGAITGGTGLTLRSAADGGTGDFLILDSATGINAGAATLNAGPARVGLDAGAGATIATGGITAALLGDANGTNTGVLTTFNHDAGTTFGDLTITDSDLDIELTAGGLTTGDVDSSNGGVLMTVAGALVAGNVVGDNSVVMFGGSLTAGDITSTTDNVIVRSLAGNLSVGSLSAVTDSISVASADGSVSVAGDVTAGTDYVVYSERDVSLGNDPGAEIQRAGGLIEIGAQGTLTGGSGLTLRSGTGGITLATDGTLGGNIAFAADSLIQGGATGVERDVVMISRTAGNSVVLGDISARGLLGGITGGPVPTNGITRDANISVDQVNLVNTLALTSNLGNVSVGGVSVTGAGQGITLQAPNGTLTAPGSLSASGNILLNGFNALTFGALASSTGSVSASSTGGTLTTGVVSGQTGVTLTANGNLSAAGANAAAGSVTLTSSTGGAALGSAAASGNIAINAALTAAIANNVTAGGNYTVNAGSVSLGSDPDAELQQATGTIDIRATSGSISGGNGLTLRSDSNGAGGGDLFLDAATNIALGGAAVEGGAAGTGNVGVRVGAGQSIAVGNTIGLTVGETDAAHAVFSPIAHDASVSFGNVTTIGTPFSIALTLGNIVTGNVSATDIALTANAGSVTTNGLTSATNVAVSASGAASIAGNVTAGGAYTVTGQSVALGVDGDAEVQRAAGAVTITANGGTLAGGDGLILRSDSNNAGGETLTLTLGAGSNLAFGQAAIEGGTNRTSLIRVNYVDPAPSLVFGDVSGTGFQSFNGITTFTNSLSGGSGNIITGDLDFSTDLFISTSGTLTTGGINGTQSVGLSSTGALTVNGPVTTADGFSGSSNASITLSDSVTAATSVGLSSSGAITGTTVSAGTGIFANGASLDFTSLATTAGALSATAASGNLSVGTVTGGGAVTLQTFGGGSDVRVDSATAAGLLTINSAGDVRGDSGARTTLNSTGGSIAVTAAAVAMLDTVTANQNINISAASIDVNGLNAVNGSLTLNSTGAGLTLGNVVGQTGVSLTALGDLSVASATSGAGAVSLASTAGNTTLGSATAAGDVGVTAALAATVFGNVTAGGNYSVTGGSVNLGVDGDPELQQAAGAVTITSNNGPLTGGTGLVLRSNSDDVGAELLTLSLGAGASLAFGAAEIEGGANRTSRVRIEAIDAAPTLVFGDVSGLTFQSNITGSFDSPNALFTGGSVTTGDLDFSAELGVFGTGVTTGSVNSGSFSELNAGAGALVVNGPVTITGQFVANGGSISFADSVTGGNQIQMNSAGAISGTTVNAATGIAITGGSVDFTGLDTAAGALNATATAGNLSVGTVDGGGAVTLQTTGGAGDVRIDSATAAGLLTINSVDQVRGDGATRANLTSTGGAVAVAAGGAIDLGTGVAATSFGVTGSAINATALTASGGALTLTAGTGGITLGSGAGQTAALSTTGTAAIATGLNTSGNSSVSAVSAALAPIVSTAGSVSITTTGGDYTGFGGGRADITAGTDVTLAVAGDALIGTLDAGGVISVTAASLDATTIDAVGAVSTTTSGATFANAVQGANITATGSSIAIGTATSGGLLDLSATAGDLTLGTGTVGGQITLTASNDILFTTLDTDVGAGLTAGSDIFGDMLSAVATVSTTAGGVTDIDTLHAAGAAITSAVIDIGSISAPGDIVLTSTVGNLTLGTGNSGGSITLSSAANLDVTTSLGTSGLVSATAAGDATIGAITSSNGAVVVTARSVDIGSVTSGGLLDLSATAGDLTLATGTAAGLADIDATGTVQIGTLNAGSALIDAGTTLNATLLDVAGALTTTSVGATTIATIDAGVADITGGSIGVGDVTTASTLDMDATAGDLTIGTGTAGGQITLTASNDILFTTLDTGAGASLTAGGDIFGDMLSAVGAVSTNAGGVTDIGALDATGIAITSAVIDIASISTPGSLALTSTVGDLTLGTGSAGTTLTLSSAANLDVTTSLTAGGLASASAVGNATIAAITSSGGDVVVTARSIDIGTASANELLDVSATGGGLTLGTGSAGGLADLDATGTVQIGTLNAGSATIDAGGALDATLFDIAGALTATSAGAATIATIEAGSATVTGSSIDVTTAETADALTLTSIAGGLALGTGASGGNAALDASGAISVGDLTSGGTAALVAGGALDATSVSATGAATTQSGGTTVIGTLAGSSVAATGTSVAIGTATAGTTLAVTASAGDAAVNGTAGTTATVVAGRDVLIGTGLTAGGATTITAGRDARLAQVTATGGALTVTATNGQVSGATVGARADLIAGGAGNALTVTASDTVLIGTANGAGGVTVNADAIDATSVAASGGAIALTATAGGITLNTGNASGDAGLTATGAVGVGSLSAANIAINGAGVTTTTLTSTGTTAITATGAASLGATTAGSSLAVTANGINAGATSAGTTMSLTSGGGITLASATAGGNATLDAAGSASLGAVTAGGTSVLRVRATDVTINGAQRAGTIELVNRAPATAMRLGDDTAAGGFALSNAEIGLLEANTLTLENGTGAVEIGTLAFDADAGRNAVNVLTTGQMDILGTISGSGTGRLFRFGGDASATGMADQIRIVSTSDAGGRLLFDTSNVELRGERIVMGLAAQFVDTILDGTPLSIDAVAGLFISNPNSALYNTLFSGQVYVDKTTLVANSLTVRFGEYALFQNTEAAGLNGGAVLGGPAGAPVMPALTLDGSNSASGDGFALFGTINGVTGTAAALLGPSVIVMNMVDIPNARVNGCLIGSGAGCLTSVVTQPTLNVFDSSRLDVLRAADDLSLPFDPVVGTNNEALFSGVSSVDTQVTGDECKENPEAPECKASEEETVQ